MKDLMRELKASLSSNKLDAKIEAAIEKLEAENATLRMHWETRSNFDAIEADNAALESENERLEIVAKAAGATAAEFMRERDALKAELAAMREQKPYAYEIHAAMCEPDLSYSKGGIKSLIKPLYAAPVAKP